MTPIVRNETQIIFEVRNTKETRSLIPKSPEIRETLKFGENISRINNCLIQGSKNYFVNEIR